MLRELYRATVLRERAGICVVSQDAPRADDVTGARERTLSAIERLKADGRAAGVMSM